jgi:hypothetical protein
MLRKLRRFLAGEDAPGRRALPLGEFLHPAPLLALVALAVNDHWLKGSGLVGAWATGKISDFAGALFFPLLSTALVDVALYLSRAPVDFTLRRWKLGAAIALTGAVMMAIELSQPAADRFAAALRAIGFSRSASTADPTDLAALVALGAAWLIGRAEIARVPLGRIEYLRRHIERGGRAGPLIADVRALRAREADAVDELAAALDARDDARAGAALERLRR